MSTKRNPAPPLAVSIHEQFRADLHRFLARRLRGEQDAGDLAQEVYLRLLRLRDSELIQKPRAYVYTIAAHVAYQFRLRSEQNPVTFDSEAAELASTSEEHVIPDTLAEQVNAQRVLEQMLRQLPQMHQAVLVLCKRDGMSYEEIAQKLGLSVHTVKKYLYEAKARLSTMDWRDA